MLCPLKYKDYLKQSNPLARNFKRHLKSDMEFLGSPVVKTWHFHFGGPRFDPWLGN